MVWIENGVEVTDAYTVFRIQLLPDLDGDNVVNAADAVLRGNVSPENGVIYGVGSNRLHRVKLRNDGHPPGTYELVLSGPRGAFRLWDSNPASGAPVLSLADRELDSKEVPPDPTINFRTYYIECLAPGTGSLHYRYTAEDGSACMGDSLRFTVPRVDIDEPNEDQVFLHGDKATFKATTTPSVPVDSWQWEILEGEGSPSSSSTDTYEPVVRNADND
jgi:hypothetical protein